MTGVVLEVSSSATGDLVLDADYSSFFGAVGGDWAARLRLVSLPACALTTPERPECREATVLPSTNDVARSRVVASVPLVSSESGASSTGVAGDGAESASPTAERAAEVRRGTGGASSIRRAPASMNVAVPLRAAVSQKAALVVSAASTTSTSATAVVALAAAPAGGGGDYAATSLSASAEWQQDGSTGGFTWEYPLPAPPGVNGPEPELSVSYSSAAVDGRTFSTNNQASWVGDGFGLDSGFVERSYVPCADDMKDGNNKTKTGDLCWKSDNATLMLGGRSSQLVRDSASGTWRLEDDDGSRIERKIGATNADNDKEYWVLTAPEGTRYYFGLGKRYSADTADTKSTLTVPVAGNHSGEPGYKAGDFAGSFLTQAWRWNLDYVVDVHGNTMTYFYTKATNRYRRDSTTKSVGYDRDAWLARVDYWQRKGTEATAAAPARVSFTVAERCIPTSDFDCAVSSLTAANASKWPDVPFDEICTSTTECGVLQNVPTFFSRKRLTRVTTQVYSGSAYTDVDSWALAHSFPGTGDGTSPSLWLKSITQTGKAGSGVTLAPVTFGGTQLPNRVAGIDGNEPLIKWRVSRIDSESGGRTDISYLPAECTASSLPTPETNTKRCFPSYWTPEDSVDPVRTWFHVYPVSQIVESDLTGGSPNKVTRFDYLGGAAWRYDDNELTKPKYRTYGEFRGFQKVRVRVGDTGARDLVSESTYLRGMDGDRLPDGTRRDVHVSDSQGGTVEDVDRAKGFLLEEITYNGPSGAEVSAEITKPWISAPTAEDSNREARLLGTASEESRTRLSGGALRKTRTTTTFDPTTGMPTVVDDAGDLAVSGDELCTRTTYVANPSLNILGVPSREETVSVGCGSTPERPKHVVSDTRTYYDGATSLTAAPTRGLATKTEELDQWSDGKPVYVTTTRTGYDVHGRQTSATDALDRVTTTAYTPASGGPVTATAVKDPMGFVTTKTLDPARGVVTAEVDANGRRTDLTYDPLGRLTGVWLPDRSKSAGSSASITFGYTVRTSGANVVTTNTLLANGKYRTTQELYDGLLRTRQTQEPAHGSDGGRLVSDTLYDSRGMAIEELGPYWATEAPSTTVFQPTTEVPARTVTSYDGAGRETLEVFYVNGVEKWRTSTTHEGDRVSIDPPPGYTPTTSITDARGQQKELRRYHGDSPTGTYDKTTTTYTPDGQVATRTGPPSAAAPGGSVWRWAASLFPDSGSCWFLGR